MEQGSPPGSRLAPPDRSGFIIMFRLPLLYLALWLDLAPPLASAGDPASVLSEEAEAAASTPPAPPADPMEGSGEHTVSEAPTSSPETSSTDPMGQSTASEASSEGIEKKNLPPLTPELANLNLAEDLELVTLDTKEKVFLPAGTYRQILRIPIDSPTMQSAQKTRAERRPEVKRESPAGIKNDQPKPLWIRYESLEKIKINDEERRGGIDLPVHGPKEVTLRLWYAKSETADTASSIFYFIFGGLGYSTANLLGWSAGNTRQIPSDFEYRLIRK